jgi:hypothetical protein
MSTCDKCGPKGYECNKRDSCKKRDGLELLFEHAMERMGLPKEILGQIGILIKNCPEAVPI